MLNSPKLRLTLGFWFGFNGSYHGFMALGFIMFSRRARLSRSSNELWSNCLLRRESGRPMPSGPRCRWGTAARRVATFRGKMGWLLLVAGWIFDDFWYLEAWGDQFVFEVMSGFFLGVTMLAFELVDNQLVFLFGMVLAYWTTCFWKAFVGRAKMGEAWLVA